MLTAPIATAATVGFGAAATTPLQAFSGDLLYLAVVFLVLALVAGLMGARGVAGLTMDIAWILIVVFIVLAVVSLVL